MGLFSSSEQTYLGIDIGDSAIKMVELKKKGKKILLSNYGFSNTSANPKLSEIDDTAKLAEILSQVKKGAGIKATKATASLPTFAVFSSIVNLHNVNKDEMSSEVTEEAKKVIPLPLKEMVLDWKIIPPSDEEKKKKLTKVFLTGSPKKLVRKYIDVFKEADVTLSSLETETFSLLRSLIGNHKSTVMIVEIGANSTDVSLVKEGVPILNRSIEVCSKTITQDLSEALGVSFEEAEQIKLDLSYNEKKQIPPTIEESIAPILNEIQYMMEFFSNNHQEKPEKIILSGGGALLFNLPEILEEKLNTQVIIGDPWARIYYPPEMKGELKELGPKLAVAVGLAMRDLE